MANTFLSPSEYSHSQRIVTQARTRYGAPALERLSDALAIAAGLAAATPSASPYQRPEFIFPGLTAVPWHEASTNGFVSEIESSSEVICAELENARHALTGFQPYRRDHYVPSGQWDALYIRIGDVWLEENRRFCPRTFGLLESVPRLAEVAMFSALSPSGHIAPHCGSWNCRITLHLGLVIPEDCALRVGSEIRTWRQGKVTAFDDTFEHEAWNKSDFTRYVLMFDVWHPDLTEIEVELLERLRREVGVRNGEATVRQIRDERTRYQNGHHNTNVASGQLSTKPFSNNSIDWGRLAEPQADQYDSDVVLELASSTTSAGRSQFYRRSPVGDSPTVFEGQVAVRYVYRSLPEFASLSTQFQDAPVDHPNIRMAAEYVRCWPVGYAQCLRLLEAIHPAMDPRIPLESIEVYRGSACHSYEQLFGTMWTTIFCPIGLAEAIVHEMAHQKLRA